MTYKKTNYTPVLDCSNILTVNTWLLSVIIDPKALAKEHVFVLIEGVVKEDIKYKAIFRKYELYPIHKKSPEGYGWGNIIIQEFSCDLDNTKEWFDQNIQKGQILKYQTFEIEKKQADYIHKKFVHCKDNPRENYHFTEYVMSRPFHVINTYCWFRDLIYIAHEENLRLPKDYKDFLSCTERNYAKTTGTIESYVDYVKDAVTIYSCSII